MNATSHPKQVRALTPEDRARLLAYELVTLCQGNRMEQHEEAVFMIAFEFSKVERETVERCAKVAETEIEPEAPPDLPPDFGLETVSKEQVMTASVQLTKEKIAERIRALVAKVIQ